ncbi:hypothetical protein B0H10DRAFT_2032329 [Mycena sp. CBHHK59/15]|nr:hypothetical protein B0H10DRAFT_2032329 [Mycena sp. CBHHK59/15]
MIYRHRDRSVRLSDVLELRDRLPVIDAPAQQGPGKAHGFVPSVPQTDTWNST